MNRKQYKKQAIKYLGEILPFDPNTSKITDKQKALFRQCPKYLYKYCMANEYTFSNIKYQQLYMNPISNLDDQFEAKLSFRSDFDVYFYKALDSMKKKFYITEELKEFSEEELKSIFYEWDVKKAARKNRGLAELPEIVSKINTDGVFEGIFTDFFLKMISIRDNTGVCSLSENNDSQIMWQMYAGNYEGCCIEYDFANCEDDLLKLDLLPVTYIDKRHSDPMEMLITTFFQELDKKDRSKINNDFCLWLADLLTTKNTEWKLQNEWRVIKKAGQCVKAPTITSIYIGNRMSEENKQRIVDLANKSFIDLYEVTEDYERLKIAFKKLGN